jgi:Flp pilus assembly pilin Flp
MVQEPTTSTSPHKPAQRGQALIEYALILVLVVMALIAAVAATGPALGNVFSNTVFNLVGITGTPQDLYARGGPTAFWMTVTYVAQNPPAARAFPTSPPKPPTATFTAGPSPTPTMMTPSATPTLTATLPPTATATDTGFDAPYVDSINNPVWWRVDTSAYLGGADWLGEYFPNTTLSGTPDRTLYNQQIDPMYRFNINFNWGTTSPLDSWLTDNYSIRYTRTITVTTPLTLNFTLAGDDGSRLKIDGTTVINNWPSSGIMTSTQTLSVGTHTLVVEYYESGGNANLSLGISANKANVAADTNKGGGAASCPWTQVTGSQPNTVAYAWKENLPTVTNGFPVNMRCNLELRGYVDLAGVASPTMSFWDVWDFGSAADTSVKLQLAEYVPYNDDLSGGPNWTLVPGYTLHTAGKNYAWTRNQFAIPAALINKKVTWRFVMESGAATSVRRWYLDDIRLGAPIATKTFGVCTVSKYTCGNFWNLDVADQKADFVTSGRWDLTNKAVASNDSGGPSLSWDVTSGANGNNGTYVKFGGEQGTTDYRIHYIAFNGQIDLRSINADGTGGTIDWESDSGFPILSFYQAYGLEDGDSIEVQYTRDSDTPGTPSNWVRVGTNPIQSVPVSGSPVTDVMKKYQLQLKDIPNWNTQIFRLRFALIISNNKEYSGAAGTTPGWYIDNIAIEREGAMKFSDYPFCDDSEGTTDSWLMGGQWGIATTSGAFQTGNSFSDSPAGNYVHGQITSMALRYPIDFNNDTPENLLTGGNFSCLNGAAFGKATRPVLQFWHWRKLAASESFKIELFRAAQAASGTTAISPTSVWTYTYNSGNVNQVVWEREELDMRAAIENVTGLTWTTLTTNTNKYDDDFYFQITFDASSNTSVSDGIYIDNILMKEYSETSFKLWDPGTSYTAKTGAPVAGTGDGTNWVDDIDSPSDWYNRWTAGSTWTSVDWDSHSGLDSLHNVGTDNTNYLHQSFNVIEMNKILDLRGTKNTDLPTMYFWTRYRIGASDTIAVEIAVQDETEMTTVPPPRNRMGYDYQYLWGSASSYSGGSNSSWSGASSWQMIWNKGSNSRNDAWTRPQIDLRNYVGKRIKVRFVINAYSDPSVGTGWWLDDIQFVFRTNDVFTVGFADNARNMRNWIPEGNWGLAPDQWRGSGGGPADLGTNPWNLYWFDCIDWTKNNSTKTAAQFVASFLNTTTCSASNWTTFFGNVPRTVAGTNGWIDPRTSATMLVAGKHFIKDFAPDVLFDFAADDRPPGGYGDSTWYDHFAGRFFRDITVTGGAYTFITTSDDGINVRVETAAGGTPNGLPSGQWNVISHWSAHSRAVDYQAITLDPGNYRIIGEYYEGSGSAVAQIQVGTNKFSFSDSPKASAVSTEVNTIPYSESALILNGVINLTTPTGYTAAQWKPRLEFYQLFDFAASNNGRVEVSTDGGFVWNQTNLNANCPSGTACDPNTFGDNDWTPSNGKDWQLRSHDLSSYVNQNLSLRFKLVSPNGTTRDGWWVTDIVIGNSGA